MSSISRPPTRGLHIAVVGLAFGEDFVPVYLHHPDVARLTICDTNPQVLSEVGERYEVRSRYARLEDVLEDPSIDAVHLVTPIHQHASQAVRVLDAGKHCASTVPAATTIDELRAIVASQRRSGRVYMMMETAVYTREFLYVQERVRSGAMGRLQFLRGAHYQDMEGWPDYWAGLPPMHYATHAIGPLLSLAGARAERVRCIGSGRMRQELQSRYGNPYPVETAIFQLEPGVAALEVTRSLFEVARGYTERFDVLGEHESFEWPQIESGPLREDPVVFRMGAPEPGRGRPISTSRVEIPDRADLLPVEIRRFTRQGVYDESRPHLSFLQGGGHGGSHPHLVNEFVRSIVEERAPAVGAVTAANWTAAGICAHESAMQGGATIEIPAFD
jgi:predicted dehydrogenase